MVGNSQNPQSSNRAYSYGNDTKTGMIINTRDPENRGRVQVRRMGYDDATGVPKEQLEWMHVNQSDSQIAGACATHNYYAGATVNLGEHGGQSFVSGGKPGFDSEKRLQEGNNDGYQQADASGNEKPDQPNIVRGQMQTSVRGQGSSGLQPSSEYGSTQFFDYSNFGQG
jgi:hypothetical protein